MSHYNDGERFQRRLKELGVNLPFTKEEKQKEKLQENILKRSLSRQRNYIESYYKKKMVESYGGPPSKEYLE